LQHLGKLLCGQKFFTFLHSGLVVERKLGPPKS